MRFLSRPKCMRRWIPNVFLEIYFFKNYYFFLFLIFIFVIFDEINTIDHVDDREGQAREDRTTSCRKPSPREPPRGPKLPRGGYTLHIQLYCLSPACCGTLVRGALAVSEATVPRYPLGSSMTGGQARRVGTTHPYDEIGRAHV